jgi:hypothetical protein
MRKILLFACIVGLGACNNKPADNKDDKEKTASAAAIAIPKLPADYTQQDLSKKGLAAKISAPAGATVYTSTLMNNEGTQDQIIVQMSDTSKIKLNIYKSSKNLATVKKDIEKDTFDKFGSWLLEDTNSAIWTKKNMMKDTEVTDFILVVEKDGKFWHLKPDQFMTPLTKDQVLNLYAMAKSLTF